MDKYSKVCITRAAVNENVCEDSHTEHVYFVSALIFLLPGYFSTSWLVDNAVTHL